MRIAEEELCQWEKSLDAALLLVQRSNDPISGVSEATRRLPLSQWPLLLGVFDPEFVGSGDVDGAAGNRLFELRKKVAFWFSELCQASSDGNTREDVTQGLASILAMPLTPTVGGDSAATVVASRPVEDVLICALVEQQCLSAGLLIRNALKVPTFCARVLKPHISRTPFDCTLLGSLLTFQMGHVRMVGGGWGAEEGAASPLQAEGTSDACFDAHNAPVVDASVSLEAWRCIDVLLTTNPPMTSEFLRAYFVEFLRCVCKHLDTPAPSHRVPPPVLQSARGPATFIGQWQSLRCMTTLLGDPRFGKLRTMLAESPALLLAILPHINDPSTHLRFEAYHALKVCIAKPNKPTPIRYLLWLNRDALIRFITAHHQDVVRQLEEEHGGHHVFTMAQREEQDVREGERDMLLDRLVNLQPLSREDMVLLDV